MNVAPSLRGDPLRRLPTIRTPRTRRAALAAAGFALALGLPSPARATLFVDVVGSATNTASVEELHVIGLSGDPGRLDVILPRAESLGSGDEIGFFTQAPEVIYDCTPPANLENRSEWYTVLSWYPGRLTGWSDVRIRQITTSSPSISLPGIQDDVSRRPGDYYTSYTATIEQVPGIEEAIRFIDMTQDGTPGLPTGDVGLAQRWIAYIRGVIQAGTCDAPGIVDGALWAWNSGIADCDGLANIFASGMRALGIPTCVLLGYAVDGGPVVDGNPFWHNPGHHAWAGIWSEGLGRFLPVDPGVREFGFVDPQRIHFVYVEDLNDARPFLVSANGTAHWRSLTTQGSGSTMGSSLSGVRVRNLLDGFYGTLVAHNTVGFSAPGLTGVPEGHPDGDASLRVSTPFGEALSLSLTGAEGAQAWVEVFDVQGRRVACLAENQVVTGPEAFYRWLPRDAASGVYLVRVRLGTGRVLLARTMRVR
jgi:hypothetical protein